MRHDAWQASLQTSKVQQSTQEQELRHCAQTQQRSKVLTRTQHESRWRKWQLQQIAASKKGRAKGAAGGAAGSKVATTVSVMPAGMKWGHAAEQKGRDTRPWEVVESAATPVQAKPDPNAALIPVPPSGERLGPRRPQNLGL
jgi:hypothetical protein